LLLENIDSDLVYSSHILFRLIIRNEISPLIDNIRGKMMYIIKIGHTPFLRIRLIHHTLLIATKSKTIGGLTLLSNKLSLGPNGINLSETTFDLVYDHFDPDILGIVVNKFLLNTHPMESMSTWENIEFTIKYWFET